MEDGDELDYVHPLVYTSSMKTIELSGGSVALVDDDDFEYFNMFKWHKSSRGYAQRADYSNSPKIKMIMMHRFLMNEPIDLQVDHINGNKLDNRKFNLRVSTKAQNMRNRNRQSNNTSGLKGVCFHIRSKKWMAQIKVSGKKIYIGLFDTKEEAYDAYCGKAKELHGEFARLL
jgi:hypothetical protein